MRSDEFSGGEQTVAARLRALGWTVRSLGNPDWTRDEIILACQLVPTTTGGPLMTMTGG
jgi:5-methylcytosine-specific restriction protein A